MNVIISNKNESVLMSLGIDVIKTLNGVFTVDDLAATFKNFYYNKMILDITAIEDYENINTIQKLVFKLIIILYISICYLILLFPYLKYNNLSKLLQEYFTLILC